MPNIEILENRLPTVAIVGRPNVGKSTLFNRIVGRRKAVVLDTPGVTRDRNIEAAEWNGRAFTVIDTGGYETEPRDITFHLMREQSLLAIEQADVVAFMVDVLEPDNPVDPDVIELLRRADKPVLIAVNKCDNPQRVNESYSFYSFGIGELFPISAISGGGVAEMLDRIVELLPTEVGAEELDRERNDIRIAVVGKPNVGKSSLVNAILGQQRVITSELPGTTRDTIDTTFRAGDRLYTIVDTAGIRRRGKIQRGVEKISVIAAEANLARAHVALVLIDAEQGVTELDERVAGYAHKANRAIILVVNKWDLIEKDTHTADQFKRDLRDRMGFVQYAPVVTLSAKTGQRVHRLPALIDSAYAEFTREIDTPSLNRWLEDATRRVSPPWSKGRQLRIKYVVQAGVAPPTFILFVNNPQLVHFSYERYLANRLREAFGFEGTPIRFKYRRKSRRREEEPEEREETR